jgi:dTDP-4-dehydrorhamnose 3,5-epimerase
MKLTELEIKGLILIEPNVFHDDRGLFFETFSIPKLENSVIPVHFFQENQSLSHKGVLRGLHFQLPPYEQGKLVRVTKGSVIDVVVDLRKSSSTFGQHLKVRLDDIHHRMLWIPPGFAHGFITLEENTVFLYKVTKVYNKESEGGILWNDPDLNIDWGNDQPIVSEKDRVLPLLQNLKTVFN